MRGTLAAIVKPASAVDAGDIVWIENRWVRVGAVSTTPTGLAVLWWSEARQLCQRVFGGERELTVLDRTAHL